MMTMIAIWPCLLACWQRNTDDSYGTIGEMNDQGAAQRGTRIYKREGLQHTPFLRVRAKICTDKFQQGEETTHM